MMSEQDKDAQIELELDEKEPEKAEIVVEEAEKEPKAASQVEDGIQELKLKLEQERLARSEAEKRAREAAEREAMAKNEVDQTNLQLVTSAIDTMKRNNEILKAGYSEAMAVGDYTKAAEIQETMSSNAVKLMQLENGRQAMEAKPKVQPEVYSAPLDPVEALASQLTPRSAAWVREHPEYARDQRMFQKMIAAHNLVVSDGIAAESDEYFNAVEDILKINRQAATQEAEDPMAETAKVTQRRTTTPPPAAPVSRAPVGRPNVVRLTADEREIAQMMGMTEKEYALNKVALQRAGKLPN